MRSLVTMSSSALMTTCALRLRILTLLLLILGLECVGAVTVYNQQPYGASATGTATATTYAAYNTSTLAAPAPPNEPTNDFTLELQSSGDGVSGLGIPQTYGNLWGFSIEMSVINQVSEYHGVSFSIVVFP